MKNIISVISFLLALFHSVDGQAQNLPLAVIDQGSLHVGTNPPPSILTRQLTDPERDNFSAAHPVGSILITLSSIPVGTSYTLNDEPMTDIPNKTFDVTDDIKNAITKLKETRTFVVKQIDAGHPAPGQPCGSITFNWKKVTNNVLQNAIQDAQDNKNTIIDGWRRRTSFSTPYDYKNNRVDLYFDENGRLLNKMPVNMDQNDYFYMHVLCLKGDELKYFVNITQGDFSPIDLSVRPFDKIITTGQSEDDQAVKNVPHEYNSVDLSAGPFTSDNFKWQIAYDSSINKIRNGPEYTVKINKLYHVGVGVSIISTSLQNPDYKTFVKAPGDTTIVAVNGGRRTLFTFNAIWYWSVFHQKKEGSVIPNGRDVLKDEPTWSLTRVFPTVGVTLDSKFKENFFVGAVYEFARGGSLTAGLHYGRINKLLDDKFQLGQTAFSGTDADIKLNQVYKAGFFIGLNVDTRILNLLFSKGQ